MGIKSSSRRFEFQSNLSDFLSLVSSSSHLCHLLPTIYLPRSFSQSPSSLSPSPSLSFLSLSLTNSLLFAPFFPSYQPPFDTHRWLVNRCGTEVTYIIDFYTGSSKRVSGMEDMPPMDLSFFLDVRPAVDGWEGLKMRLGLGRDLGGEVKAEDGSGN